MSEIEQFIHRRFGDTDAHWQDGNCYYFAIILCHRFPELEIYYEPIMGHFVAGDGERFYDSRGQYSGKYAPQLLSDLQKQDPDWALRLLRDCAL